MNHRNEPITQNFLAMNFHILSYLGPNIGSPIYILIPSGFDPGATEIIA
jgi:hypothetical protein